MNLYITMQICDSCNIFCISQGCPVLQQASTSRKVGKSVAKPADDFLNFARIYISWFLASITTYFLF